MESDHPSDYERAQRRLEREFHDDEDYFIVGAPPSMRLRSYSSAAPPREGYKGGKYSLGGSTRDLSGGKDRGGYLERNGDRFNSLSRGERGRKFTGGGGEDYEARRRFNGRGRDESLRGVLNAGGGGGYSSRDDFEREPDSYISLDSYNRNGMDDKGLEYDRGQGPSYDRGQDYDRGQTYDRETRASTSLSHHQGWGDVHSMGMQGRSYGGRDGRGGSRGSASYREEEGGSRGDGRGHVSYAPSGNVAGRNGASSASYGRSTSRFFDDDDETHGNRNNLDAYERAHDFSDTRASRNNKPSREHDNVYIARNKKPLKESNDLYGARNNGLSRADRGYDETGPGRAGSRGDADRSAQRDYSPERGGANSSGRGGAHNGGHYTDDWGRNGATNGTGGQRHTSSSSRTNLAKGDSLEWEGGELRSPSRGVGRGGRTSPLRAGGGGHSRAREVKIDARDADQNSFSRGSSGGGPGRQTSSSSAGGPGGGLQRQASRVVYSGEADAREKQRRLLTQTSRVTGEERAFLGKVQRELEDQRREWKGEMDRLSSASLLAGGRGGTGGLDAVKDSMVDTSSGRPIFKAFVDVSEFPANSVKVSVDRVANKVVVEARMQEEGLGSARSFTQRVQLPRYADEQSLVARMNRCGVLKVEVPLLYYFPEAERVGGAGGGAGGGARSFVYEVRTDPVDGSKVMEILVSTGRDVSTRDLTVQLEGDKLQVWAEQGAGGAAGGEGEAGGRSLIKQYTMPTNADVDRMKSSRTKDGRLSIIIPIV